MGLNPMVNIFNSYYLLGLKLFPTEGLASCTYCQHIFSWLPCTDTQQSSHRLHQIVLLGKKVVKNSANEAKI